MAQGPNSVAGAMTAISGELRGRIVSGMRCTLWLSYMLHGFTVPRSQVRLLTLIAGILMYESMDSAWFRGKLIRKGEIFAICIFLASLAFVYFYDARPQLLGLLPKLTAGKVVLPVVGTFQGPYKVIVLSISCAMLAFYSFEFKGLLKGFLSWNPLRYLGNMNYSYYLIHGLAFLAAAVIAYSIVPDGPSESACVLAGNAARLCNGLACIFLLVSLGREPNFPQATSGWQRAKRSVKPLPSVA